MVRFASVLLALLVVVVALLVHFYTLRELGQPSAEARAALLASDHLSHFARLSFGLTRYRVYSVEALAGQGLVDQGTLRRHQERFGSSVTPELVVLVHGYALSSDLMHQLAVDLVSHWATSSAAKPIKVLTYDLYGRGYSDAPKEPSTEALYTSQLAELLFAIQGELGTVRATVLGMSMGGAIAAKFATVYPSIVERLVLMAPAGLPLPVPILGQLGSLPLVGELVFARVARPSLHAFVRETMLSESPEAIKHTIEKVNAAIDLHPGMLDTLMYTVRHFPMSKMEPVFRALGHPEAGHTPIPTLIAWPEKDTTTPYENLGKLRALIPHANAITVPNAAHSDILVNAELCAAFAKSMVAFMRSGA